MLGKQLFGIFAHDFSIDALGSGFHHDKRGSSADYFINDDSIAHDS